MTEKRDLPRTAHVDTFVRDHLPPVSDWPEFILGGFEYPAVLNAAHELTDRMSGEGFGENVALIGVDGVLTYRELTDWTNQLARALVEVFGIVPGNRVLIRSPNCPGSVACWLAATKAGAVVVNTVPMLRSSELATIVNKARISLALCHSTCVEALETCCDTSAYLEQVVCFDGGVGGDAELDRVARTMPKRPVVVDTSRDDPALIAFTSGSTGEPKAAVHCHRDLLTIADGYARDVLGIEPKDIVIGTPPLAFTFGLGALAIFPLRFGAAAVLVEGTSPASMLELIERYSATILFTAPTGYRSMLRAFDGADDLSSLRLAVSAGEALPAAVYDDWIGTVGVPLLDGIGATELLHIFISNTLVDTRPGYVGREIRGYTAKVVDANLLEVERGTPGRLAVRGPTGCRYLSDPRQRDYVRGGWNLTGDNFIQSPEGHFKFVARSDDIILSSGYNIAAPEVESALLGHPYVAECAVIGVPDPERGQLVEAHVVLADGVTDSEATIRSLQDHVKASIAPYKYPRSVVIAARLPKTTTGKIQRQMLRSPRNERDD